MLGIWWTYQGFCSSPFPFSRGSLFALFGLFSGFVECLKDSVSFWSKTLTVCSDSVPAEVPFYASSLEFVECLREFRRFAKCAPPLNEFSHFFLVILRWESFNFSRFRWLRLRNANISGFALFRGSVLRPTYYSHRNITPSYPHTTMSLLLFSSLRNFFACLSQFRYCPDGRSV